QETNRADDYRQYADMLQNTDQGGDEDDRAKHFQEEECQAFIVLSLINPYRVDASEENIQMSNLHEGQSFFEMLGEYILAG
ncbi:hypothetical protein V5G94_25365, partial [Citrobacter braakii]